MFSIHLQWRSIATPPRWPQVTMERFESAALKQRPIQSMEEARDWKRLFIGEVKAGRDPRRPRTPRKPTDVAPKGVASSLDSYVEQCLRMWASIVVERVDVISAAKQLKALAMPADQRVWFHDGENSADRRRVVGATGFHLTLDVQGKLLP